MNYLAHAYLSFNNPPVLVGNLISDFVKGKKVLDYPAEIQAGIMLHRAIDAFTDTHPATAAAKEIFRPAYRLYSGAFVDVVYDHFLATDTVQFGDNGLYAFSQQVYAVMDEYISLFPPAFARMYPYMKKHNWMYGYAQRQGIQNSFEGLVHRAAYLSDSTTAYQLFERHYEALQQFYNQFFPAVRTFALHSLTGLDEKD